MASKYIYFDDTQKTLVEKEATTQSSGSGDAGKIVALHTDGKLHSSLMPTGIGADAITVPAYENLSAGDFVNIFLDSGTAKARKADATSISKRAVGFVLEAVSAGQNATVYKEGSNTALSGRREVFFVNDCWWCKFDTAEWSGANRARDRDCCNEHAD